MPGRFNTQYLFNLFPVSLLPNMFTSNAFERFSNLSISHSIFLFNFSLWSFWRCSWNIELFAYIYIPRYIQYRPERIWPETLEYFNIEIWGCPPQLNGASPNGFEHCYIIVVYFLLVMLIFCWLCFFSLYLRLSCFVLDLMHFAHVSILSRSIMVHPNCFTYLSLSLFARATLPICTVGQVWLRRVN